MQPVPPGQKPFAPRPRVKFNAYGSASLPHAMTNYAGAPFQRRIVQGARPYRRDLRSASERISQIFRSIPVFQLIAFAGVDFVTSYEATLEQ